MPNLGDKFVKKNKNNGYLIINGKKTKEIKTHANLEKGENKIKIIFTKKITDLSYMFNCYGSNLIDISPLENLDVSNVISFENMFSYCENLVDISPLKNWNVSNSKSFKLMFYYCLKLVEISPLKNWDVSNSTSLCSGIVI